MPVRGLGDRDTRLSLLYQREDREDSWLLELVTCKNSLPLPNNVVDASSERGLGI